MKYTFCVSSETLLELRTISSSGPTSYFEGRHLLRNMATWCIEVIGSTSETNKIYQKYYYIST